MPEPLGGNCELKDDKMLIIDKYAYSNRLAKADPVRKMLFSFSMLILSIAVKNIFFHAAIILFMGGLTVIKAGISVKNYIKIILWPLSFLIVSMVGICLSFSTYGMEVERVFLSYLRWNDLIIGITRQGVTQALLLFMRSNAAVSCMFFMSLTTSVDQQAKAFYRLRFNKVFIELYVLVYRFISIFLEESVELYQAQNMRFGYRNFRVSFASFAILVKQLFVRVMSRYEDMQASLAMKLFNGTFYYDSRR